MRSTKLRFVLAVFLVACAILGSRYYEVDLALWHMLHGPEVDPAELHLRGEFVESNLGAAQESDGITVRMIAQQYVFVPRCIQVPAGVPVRIRITSADVVHLLSFHGVDFSVKAVPGHVTENRRIFPNAGDFPMPCHEFCGPGHFAMRAELSVVPQAQFPRLRPDERRDCVIHP